MKMRSILLKASVVVVASYFTWHLTSTVIAQQQAKKEATKEPEVSKSAKAQPHMSVKQGSQSSPLEGGIVSGRGVVASISLRRISMAVVDGNAVVSAVAAIRDRRETMNFLWRLRVYTPDQKTFAKRVYSDQIFSVPTSGLSEPTFADTIDMPPGTSNVELTLYGFPKGTDLKFLDDEETANKWRVTHASRELVVE